MSFTFQQKSTQTAEDSLMLKEDSSYLLLETGDNLVLEQSILSAGFIYQTKN